MSRSFLVTFGPLALFLFSAAPALAAPPRAPSGDAAARNDGAQARPTPSALPGGTSPNTTPEDPFSGKREASAEAQASWGYSSGTAPRANFVRPVRESVLSINPIGFYQGVSISGENAPPSVRAGNNSMGSVLTWTGFERAEESSRVFFQLSSSVTPEIETKGLQVTVRLPRTAVNVKNNRRRLDTSFFNTPVTDVQIRRKGAETIATLTLRREAIPQWSVIPGSNGYQLLVIEFLDPSSPAPSSP